METYKKIIFFLIIILFIIPLDVIAFDVSLLPEEVGSAGYVMIYDSSNNEYICVTTSSRYPQSLIEFKVNDDYLKAYYDNSLTTKALEIFSSTDCLNWVYETTKTSLFWNNSYIIIDSSQTEIYDSSGFKLYPIFTTYVFNPGDIVLFDNPGDEITIKASFSHAIEMNIRQYVNGEVTTQWISQIADQTYVVPQNGYLEFEFLSTTDGEPIEIETTSSPVQLEQPTIAKITLVNGESEYNKVTFINRRTDNFQINVHAKDSTLLESSHTHIIIYEEIEQLGSTFWNPVGQIVLGSETRDTTVILEPDQRIDVWNVARTTEIEYIDKALVSVEYSYEEYNINTLVDLPYYEPPTYIPDLDNTGQIQQPELQTDSVLGYVSYVFDVATNIISTFANGIKSMWNSIGQMGQVMNDIFSFMPVEIRNTLYVGTLLGVILRVFGR